MEGGKAAQSRMKKEMTVNIAAAILSLDLHPRQNRKHNLDDKKLMFLSQLPILQFIAQIDNSFYTPLKNFTMLKFHFMYACISEDVDLAPCTNRPGD